MAETNLVVMAAGIGSRYGGLKQLEPVGPSGEVLLDYAVHDALAAGVRRVVFVVRRDIEAAFRAVVGSRYETRAEIAYAFQELDDLPAGFSPPTGRGKPWGTGHALHAARAAADGPVIVINADDFYGPESFALLARFLAAPPDTPVARHALVAYRLANTLSAHGTVSRGVCDVDGEGWLRRVTEWERIEASPEGPVHTGADGSRHLFTGGERVSMNCWGFAPSIFAQLGPRLSAFLAARGDDPAAEFYLPAAVNDLLAEGSIAVRAFATEWPWFGITHRQEADEVRRRLAELVARGVYRSPLWE
ncbi:MAG: NTP transferase domain-containing protein [Acidobacteriota bacterium]